MTFQFSTQLKKLTTIEWCTGKAVQTVKNTRPNGRATAEPAGPWHLFPNRAGKTKPADARTLEETTGRFVKYRRQGNLFRRAGDCHVIIEPECYSEAVKPRSKVRYTRGDANSNC